MSPIIVPRVPIFNLTSLCPCPIHPCIPCLISPHPSQARNHLKDYKCKFWLTIQVVSYHVQGMNAPVEQLTRSFQERQDGGDCTHLIKTNFKVAYLAVHLGSPFRQSIKGDHFSSSWTGKVYWPQNLSQAKWENLHFANWHISGLWNNGFGTEK